MFKEWKIQLDLINNNLDDIRYYFKDFIQYFIYIGKFLWNGLCFVVFPIYYLGTYLYLLLKIGTYKSVDKFMNNLFNKQGNLEIHSFDNILDRGLPNVCKRNINKWVKNNQDKIYDYNKPESPEYI
jgi:hypothetical protein